MAGTQGLKPSSADSQGVHSQEAGLEAEDPGLEPGTLIFDMIVPSSVLTAVPNTYPICLVLSVRLASGNRTMLEEQWF